VDVEALVDNARTIAKIAGTRLLPVVKANAYGVGAVLVSKALEPLDPWGYGVATIEEGAELRTAGIARPILVFMPARAKRFDDYDRYQLTPVLGEAGSILEWAARGERPFHVEIDTGMGRAGVRWDEVDELEAAVDTPAFQPAPAVLVMLRPEVVTPTASDQYPTAGKRTVSFGLSRPCALTSLRTAGPSWSSRRRTL